MDKLFLRQQYQKIRANIIDKPLKDARILAKLLKIPQIRHSAIILTYVSLPTEVDTLKLIEYFTKNHTENQCPKIAVPKVVGKNLEFYQIEDLKTLKPGHFGVLEPTSSNNCIIDFENAICIVPGICFDRHGYRIGYGKGFYDRFLHQHQIPTIGLCYQECITNDRFQASHDVPVDLVITD